VVAGDAQGSLGRKESNPIKVRLGYPQANIDGRNSANLLKEGKEANRKRGSSGRFIKGPTKVYLFKVQNDLRMINPQRGGPKQVVEDSKG